MQTSSVLLSALLTLSPLPATARIDIHVSPTATPGATWTAQEKVPVSLEEALRVLKSPELRDASGAPKEAIYIHLAPGYYRLTQAIRLDAASGGTAEHHVTISGPESGDAVLSGGRTVYGFAPVTDDKALARLSTAARKRVLAADLPKQGITNFGRITRRGLGHHDTGSPLEVFYRNQPMPLARWPNEGFTKIETTPDGPQGRRFALQVAKLTPWQGEPDLLATGYWFHYWSDETIPLESINLATGQLTLPAPGHGYGIKPGQPVFIQNALAELDRPGEWYLDRSSGQLYFWPPQPLKDGDVEVSIADNLLTIAGAQYITLSGLTFENARTDAINIQGGHHVAIRRSTIRNVGNRGAIVTGANSGLAEMRIENTGADGVVLNGGDRQTLTPANLFVEHSRIKSFGRLARTYRPGVRLSGVGNRAVGNVITDAPHSAILFEGNDHLISINEISNVCKETGDAGAIYTGRDWTARGTVISYNYLHDIAPNTALGRTRGVYLDDYTSGITVRGNLFEKVFDAIFINGGRDNLIEDNTFLKADNYIRVSIPQGGWDKVSDEMKTYMEEKLKAVPYNQNPYKDRYPHLANILEDEPGKPKYNISRRNLVVGNAAFSIHKNAEGGINLEGMYELRGTQQ